MPFTIDRARLDSLSPEERKEAEDALRILDEVQRTNPLAFFEPHEAQWEAFRALTSIIAIFAGNRYGKTTVLAVRLLMECLDEDWLPACIRPLKRWNSENAPRGTQCRIVNPSFALLESVILPAFRQWTPAGALRGGSFDKAFKGAPDRRLVFANGSSINFMTHEQDLDKFGGSALHVMGYDEPPPQDIREECKYRLADHGGYEIFACTPLKVNVGWMRRDIYRQREASNVTVIRGSIHDNPHVSERGKLEALEMGDPRLRQAREHGDFVNVGGLIYPDFERCVIEPPDPELVRSWEHVCGIDPGIRNAGFAFVGFDQENVAYQFDEGLLQDKTPADYARFIRQVYEKWGVPLDDVLFVVDPSARARSQTNAETVQIALSREGIWCVPGQNDVEAGITQGLLRMQNGRWWVSKDCRLTRDQADEYAAEDRGDGEFKPIKSNDHILDSCRYIWMSRPVDYVLEEQAPEQRLGWVPGQAPKSAWLRKPKGGHPMGSLA